MQFSFEFTSSAEQIYEKITDPAFITNRCEALGCLEAASESDGLDLPKITTTRLQQAELPAIMKKVLGEQQKTITVEQWSETDENYDNQSQTSISGTPIKINATQTLYNTETGSKITIDLTVVAKIPLIGKKVEPMIATKIRKELLREFEYLEDTLN